MPDMAGPAGPLAIFAGRGDLPRKIAESRIAQGQPYLLIIFPDCFEPWMADHPHEFHPFEKIGALFKSLRRAGIAHVTFAGAMNRPHVRPWRADLKAVALIPRVLNLLRKGDDEMLRGFAALLEGEGFNMVGPMELLGQDLTVRAGAIGSVHPTERHMADARRAAAIIAVLGPLDVGQAAVVAEGICLGVEAIEGTDLLLKRVAELPPERRAVAPPPSGVLFKGPKPGQDMRMDMPTIGPSTVDAAAEAGLSGIVVAAEQTAVTDLAAVRARADHHKIFVFGAKPEELQDRDP